MVERGGCRRDAIGIGRGLRIEAERVRCDRATRHCGHRCGLHARHAARGTTQSFATTWSTLGHRPRPHSPAAAAMAERMRELERQLRTNAMAMEEKRQKLQEIESGRLLGAPRLRVSFD